MLDLEGLCSPLSAMRAPRDEGPAGAGRRPSDPLKWPGDGGQGLGYSFTFHL